MTLEAPQNLWIGVLPLLIVLYFFLRRRSNVRPQLFLLSGPAALRRESRRAKWRLRLLFASLVTAILALTWAAARPVMLTSWTKKTSEGIDIVMLQDTSESMDADDFPPSRIIVARALLKDFIRRRSEDRIGLVVFSGDAVTKCPLTRDYDFLLSQVDDIHLRELKQGTAIGMGIANAVARLRRSESKTKIIVLLTDGDSNVGAINPITAAYLAKQEGIKIYSIGIGKSDRVVVPIYAYDNAGHRGQLIAEVPSYLNPALLREISRITGGNAYMARDNGMLTRILLEIDKLEKTKVKMTPMQRRDELFYYPALIGTIALFLAFLLMETRFRKARRLHVAPV
jgi:Ca-activated chloride channel family protein